MAVHSELEVDFIKMIDQVLIYNREACIDMHTSADPEVREKFYCKAEAAREIIMLLGKTVLNTKEFKVFQKAIQERLEAVYQAVFFDPATRKLITQAKEQRNGGY